MELWVADHQRKMNKVEDELQQARDEIRRIATRIPLPGSPKTRPLSPEPLQLWHSLARPSSTSVPMVPNAPRPLPTRPALRSPIQLASAPPTRRLRRPAIPSIPTGHASPPPWRNPYGGGAGGPPSSLPSEPPSPPLPPTPSPPPSPRNPPPTFTPAELIQLVAEGVVRTQQYAEPRTDGVHTSHLKIENPEKFDGKSQTVFNQCWKSVTMYLGFYPETIDQQKMAWVGTLLTDTVLVWHLH